MKKYSIILSLAVLIIQSSYGQLTIEQCYEKAEANYPLIVQYDLIEKSKDYNLSNASKGYLPQIQLSAKATYQSDVTQIPIAVDGLKGLSKDQYDATVDINQSIWDGGAIKAQKENIGTQAEVEKKNLDVTMYSIRDRVNQLFFGVLLNDEMLTQNTIYQEDLERNYNEVSAYVQTGLANQADLDAVEVERVKAVQNRTELIYSRNAYLEMLSAMIGEPIDHSTELVKPDTNRFYTLTNNRPELDLYDAQFRNLDAQKTEISAGLRPKFNAFVTGGYGKPGLNILKDKFTPYYIAGVSLSWNFGNFYTRKNSLGSIEVNKSMIASQRETFLFNTGLDMTQNVNEIEKIRQLLDSDRDIIRLRGSVRRSAEAKAANGTLSVLDLMKEVNAEQSAIQDRILHEIQLLQAIYNLKYITNN
ncbi:MAG: TolC family protein [Rikenellaceae bacterium]|nr:TolC family protein [Rikenellaceae bacterium]